MKDESSGASLFIEEDEWDSDRACFRRFKFDFPLPIGGVATRVANTEEVQIGKS